MGNMCHLEIGNNWLLFMFFIRNCPSPAPKGQLVRTSAKIHTCLVLTSKGMQNQYLISGVPIYLVYVHA